MRVSSASSERGRCLSADGSGRLFVGGQASGVALDGPLEIVLHGKQGVAFAVGAALPAVDPTLLVALKLVLDFLGGGKALSASNFHHLGIQRSHAEAETSDVFVGGREAAADVDDVLGFGGKIFGIVSCQLAVVGHRR